MNSSGSSRICGECDGCWLCQRIRKLHSPYDNFYSVPPGTLVQMILKVSMTTELFVNFIQQLARFKAERAILLIFKGAS